MDRTAKINAGVLAVVILLIMCLIFFRVFHVQTIGAVSGAITITATAVLLYVCMKLYQHFNNPYFKMAAVSYGFQLAMPIIWSVASLGGFFRLLSLGGSVPASTPASWLNAVPTFLVMYAALLYRESWQDDAGIPVIERFSALVPAANTFNFWVALTGAPLVYNAAYVVTRFHVLGATYNVRFEGYPPVPTGALDVLTKTVIMLIMLLTVIFNGSLFTVYKSKFFRYMYAISLITLFYSVVWGIISLYIQWLFVPPHMSQAPGWLLGHNALYLNLVPAVYQVVIPVFTALVFFSYEESNTA